MYAYIDETGNTGANLFDDAQPAFMTAALICKRDFDLAYPASMKALAHKVDVDVLHANELGIVRVEDIATDLLRILKRSHSRFFVSRVDKKYLAATKIFDTIFDSGVNVAVPWHSYNVRHLRTLMVFKFTMLLDEPLTRAFWSSMLERREEEANGQFVKMCEILLERVTILPDQRSQDLISDAVQWAKDNPQVVYSHPIGKIARYGHLPNMVAFPSLLDGIESWSGYWRAPVVKIYHDRQMQFGKSLKLWHELFSNVDVDPIMLPGGERYVFKRVFGSEFVMTGSEDSPGIQAIDMILWLLKRMYEGKSLGPNSSDLMFHVIRNAKHSDLSFESASSWLGGTLKELMQAPLSDEQIQKAQEMLDISDSRRQQEMLNFVENKRLEASG